MAFEASAKSFYLEGGHILVAEVSDTDGDYVNATIDLDKYIGNEDGWFMWGGVGTCCLFPPSSSVVQVSRQLGHVFHCPSASRCVLAWQLTIIYHRYSFKKK